MSSSGATPRNESGLRANQCRLTRTMINLLETEGATEGNFWIPGSESALVEPPTKLGEPRLSFCTLESEVKDIFSCGSQNTLKSSSRIQVGLPHSSCAHQESSIETFLSFAEPIAGCKRSRNNSPSPLRCLIWSKLKEPFTVILFLSRLIQLW